MDTTQWRHARRAGRACWHIYSLAAVGFACGAACVLCALLLAAVIGGGSWGFVSAILLLYVRLWGIVAVGLLLAVVILAIAGDRPPGD